MTAQVVILNRDGVAIAADSAVSLSAPGSKIYNTANKLFEMSAVEPVAAMVYGTASFVSIPWETVIKEHRRRLASTIHSTVEEYASALIGYLPTLLPHVSQDEQRSHVYMAAVRELNMVRERADEMVASAENSPTEPEVRAAILYIVDGAVAGRVRSWRCNGVCIGEDQFASVHPFAQEDMVVTFMDGLHPHYRSAFQDLVDETIGLLVDHFIEQVKGEPARERGVVGG